MPRIMPRRSRPSRRCAAAPCRRRAYLPDELCPECEELVPDEYLEAPPRVRAEVVRLRVRRWALARSWERVTGEPPRLVDDAAELE